MELKPKTLVFATFVVCGNTFSIAYDVYARFLLQMMFSIVMMRCFAGLNLEWDCTDVGYELVRPFLALAEA